MNSYTKITSSPLSTVEYFQKLWEKKYLVFPITIKDLKLKYSYTYLGLLWSLASPFLSIALYIIFFGFVFKIKIEEGSFILFVIAGYTAWYLFSSILSQCGNSVIQNQDLVHKLDFPKIILPLSRMFVVLTESSILIAILIMVSIFYGQFHLIRFVFFPLVLLGLVVFAFSLGLLISALTIKKRDLLHSLPTLIQVTIWFTPVFYPLDILPSIMKVVVALNPLTVFLETIRWALGFPYSFHIETFLSMTISLIFIIFSFYFFKNKEEGIVDFI